jgi:hypothetical protein
MAKAFKKKGSSDTETAIRARKPTPGDPEVGNEVLADELHDEMDIAAKAALNEMPDGMAAAHRIVSACHGMKDVLHGHRNVEGPMQDVISTCKDVMDKMESHVRDNHDDIYGDHESKKDLPTYDMDTPADDHEDETTQDDEESSDSAKSIIGKSFGGQDDVGDTELDRQLKAALETNDRHKSQLGRAVR